MTRATVVVIAACLVGCSFEISAGSGGPRESVIDGAIDGTGDAAIDAPGLNLSAFSGLDGQQWLLPCITNLGSRNCTSQQGVITRSVLVGGTSAQHWLVTIRIRGAMEAITYAGGTSSGLGWHVGGTPGDGANNYYKLEVTQPPQSYWLNEGTPTAQRSFRYDYMVQVPIHGGATVQFRTSGQDDRQWGNYDQNAAPITFVGLTTTPSPYDGQFAQLDVVTAISQ